MTEQNLESPETRGPSKDAPEDVDLVRKRGGVEVSLTADQLSVLINALGRYISDLEQRRHAIRAIPTGTLSDPIAIDEQLLTAYQALGCLVR